MKISIINYIGSQCQRHKKHEELQENKRQYELFNDPSYYDMWCVRDKSDRDYNSRTSWHFALKEDAEKLLELFKLFANNF